MSDIVHNVVLEDEFRTCPICRYEDGFHTILRRNAESDEVRWLFVCPSCHEVFDIGQTSRRLSENAILPKLFGIVKK